MSPQTLFQLHLVLGYVAWLLCFGVYILPKLRSAGRSGRARAPYPTFAFFGSVFFFLAVVVFPARSFLSVGRAAAAVGWWLWWWLLLSGLFPFFGFSFWLSFLVWTAFPRSPLPSRRVSGWGQVGRPVRVPIVTCPC